MPGVPYHTHPFTILTATPSDIAAGASDALVATPASIAPNLDLRTPKSNMGINACDYGAVPNAGTDQAPALRLALAAAIAQGRDLYIPSGTYLLYSIVGVQSYALQATAVSNLIIRGAGKGANRF